MILSNINSYKDVPLLADVCIIGGGPAAISLALSFEKTNYKVILIPGGGWTQTRSNQNLYKGAVTPEGTHEAPEKMRRRQFGGGSAVWAGRCVPFDPIDFEQRSWIEESGWPIKYPELQQYFQHACELCKIGQFDFKAGSVFPDKQKEIIPGLDSSDFSSDYLEKYSTPINFAKAYKPVLENSFNIRVLLDAHALNLEMLNESDKINSTKIMAKGVEMNVSAKYFVLATGGIENARLLLASANSYFPTGIGNQNDNVGRYYMTHITGTYIKINPVNRENILFHFERDNNGVFCRRRWRLTESTQKSKKLLNTIFYLWHANSPNEGRPKLFAATYDTVKDIVDATGFRNFLRKQIRQKGKAPAGLEKLYSLGYPAILPSEKSKYWGIFFSAEQVPNRESRIMLSAHSIDPFGLPRVEVNVAFKDIDIEALVEAHNMFAKRFTDEKLGEVIYSEEGFRAYLKSRFTNFDSYAHHMGTTRMSDNPETGVVDKDAKIFGINNLFVSGASTFPTGSHANPTLTVVAQALKLAEHLKDALANERPDDIDGFIPVAKTA